MNYYFVANICKYLMKIFLPVLFLFVGLFCNAQSSHKLKGSFYFYHDYFAYINFGVQQDGKIVFCGSIGRDDDADIFVSRYNFDGTIDETFGNKGMLFFDIAGYKDVPVFFKVLPNDEMLIGVIADNAYSYRTLRGSLVLIKLLADGGVDMSFGQSGKFFERPNRHYKGLMAGATQPNGNIFLLRRYDSRNQFDVGITSITAAGETNTGFGNNGNVSASARKFDDNGIDIFAEATGNLLITGQSHTGPSDVAISAGHRPVDIYLMRFTSYGDLDNSFGNNGKVITGFNSGNNFPSKIAVDERGRIRIAGTVSTDRQHGKWFVYGFLPNGSIDSAFGKKGVLGAKNAGNAIASDIAFADSGQFFIAGHNIKLGQPHVFISKIKEDGKLDTSFAKTGIIQLSHISKSPQIVVMPDGRVILGAMSTIERRNYFVVTCYLPNGKVDPMFGSRSNEMK